MECSVDILVEEINIKVEIGRMRSWCVEQFCYFGDMIGAGVD